MKAKRITREAIKQRRAENRCAKRDRLQKRMIGAVLYGSTRVDVERLGHNVSYGWPDFVERGFYADKAFTCKDCGEPQVWTAEQQKWWYETVQGDMWTTAIRCRPCRLKERSRKILARATHLNGLAAKAINTSITV